MSVSGVDDHSGLCLYYYSNSSFLGSEASPPLEGHQTDFHEEVYSLDQIKEWEFSEKRDEEVKSAVWEALEACGPTVVFPEFFRRHSAYDLIPSSSKLLILDSRLCVKKAFYALLYNGVRAAPLWESRKQSFVGMLTITDFIKVLRRTHESQEIRMRDLEDHTLENWRELQGDAKTLIYISPRASLYEAVETLILNQIHRLPVIDPHTNNALYILTHKRIIRYLFQHINDLPQPDFLKESIYSLGIGTFSGIKTAFYTTQIIDALNTFVKHRISALPIVDEENKLVDIYAKFDVINLAADKTYENLEATLRSANAYRNEWFKGVHKCKKTDSLMDVMAKIVKAEVHRLVIVEEDDRVLGVISLSDILKYIVLHPRI